MDCVYAIRQIRMMIIKLIRKEKISELNRDANLFSTELLMPEDFIRDNIDQGIDFLKKKCGVSRQAMEFRLKNLGLDGSGKN